ncbi:MAG TPA: hypothetical protein VFN74_18130 [Chloroflexota bacterium]|nr:hypothetical protein [Chloroflexota bacterium]
MSRRRAPLLVGTFLAALLLASCSGDSASAPAPTSTASPATAVRVRSATTNYYLGGPGDPVVELRVVLENNHTRHTESTSILWDPEFARQFTYLRSEPDAWRVRVDESGWGSFDATGVIPGQFATYKLWFAAGTPSPLEPRLKVIANGSTLVAETVAIAPHLAWQRPRAEQSAFERGPVALLTAPAALVPAGPRLAFTYAVLLALTLLAVTLTGSWKAFRTAAR